MKRLLSLLLVVVMLFAVLAMVGCDNGPDETTASSSTSDTTASNTTATSDTTNTTATSDTTNTTATSDTTETTTKPSVVVSSEATEGTTLPVFARFDFGTKTKAEAEGKTSHEYLTSALTYNANCLAIEYTEDTIVIYAMQDWNSKLSTSAFALCFEDIITYDFDEEMIPGSGSWSGYPVNTSNYGNDSAWSGRYQYMKIRILNNTANNQISVEWHRTGESGYFTTTRTNFLYLQGGAPTTTSDNGKTATASKEWKTYTYDMEFLSGCTRQVTMVSSSASYVALVEGVKNQGYNYSHNWNTGNGKISAFRFHLLGAYSSRSQCDTRENIKEGAKVEVDYILFGCSIDQLAGYTSYLEDSSNAAN